MSDEQAKDPEPHAGKAQPEASKAEGKPHIEKVEKVEKVEKAEKAAVADGPTAADGDRRDLPKWNRARVKRKAPAGEEQDAFQVSVRKAGRGLLQRPWAVLGLMVALSGVGAGIYAWRQSSESERAESTEILANAAAHEARGQVAPELLAQLGDRPSWIPAAEDEAKLHQRVDEALADLEARAPDSPANVAADLVRAARLARASDFVGAEKAYRGFIERQPGHPLVYLARDGLVISLEAQGRIDEALSELEPLLGETGDFFRDRALWHKGRMLEASGQGDAALEIYRLYTTEYPLDQPSLSQIQVRARLQELDPEAVPPLPGAGLPGLGGLGLDGLSP